MSEDDKGSFDDRINRARERMSTDYDVSAPRRPAAPAGGTGGSVITQFLSSDTGTRRLVYGAAGLGGLLVLGIGGWALMGHHQSGIPVLGPPPVSMRTKPVDPGGMQVDGLSAPEADDGQAHPVPAPEKPNPGALAAQYGQQAADTAATENSAPGDTAHSADQAKAPPAGGDVTASDGSAATLGTPAQADTSQQPETLPDSSTGVADESAAGDAAAGAPAVAPSAPVASKTAPKAAAKKAAPAEGAETASKTEESRPAASTATGGKYRVQLAALQTEAQAQQEWTRLKTRYSTLFADRTPVIEKVQRDNAIFYRLRVGGFASVAETRSFCSAARERGLGCTQVH